MMVFKRKQIVALSLVIMIVIAGYLQYTYNRSSAAEAGKSNKGLGEAVYVGSNGSDAQGNSAENKSSKQTSASKEANDYFIQTRLEKQVAREKSIETMKGVMNDTNASKEVQNQAYNQVMQTTALTEKEARIESLIQEKCNTEALVVIGDDKSVDVVVKAVSLTSSQTTQIADIVSRQANVDMTGVHVRCY